MQDRAWNRSPHYRVKCRTSIHWLLVTRILLRNFLFKQLRCELQITMSMDFYYFLNFFAPKLYRFPHTQKWTRLHALKICPTAPSNAQGDLTDSLPSVVERAFSSDTSVTSLAGSNKWENSKQLWFQLHSDTVVFVLLKDSQNIGTNEWYTWKITFWNFTR